MKSISTALLEGELTIEDLMTDPIIDAVMLADHVDSQAPRAMLHSVAFQLRGASRDTEEAAPSPPRMSWPARVMSIVCPTLW